MFVIAESATVEGYALIVPSVSYGNVGQLAVDLLICETQAVKIGCAWHPAVFPVVGTNPYKDSSSDVITAIEIYRSEKDKLVFMQIRGPMIKKLCSNFLQNLIQEIKNHKIDRVFILTGADDFEKNDAEIQQSTIKCIVSPALADIEETFQSTSEDNTNVTDDIKISEVISNDLGYKVSGCGFTKSLYALCVKEKLPTAVIMKHCSEGYNIPEAVAVVEQLNKWLHVIADVGNFKSVPSWRYVFGGAEERSNF